VTPKVITFDCAGTLVRANWRPDEVALASARALGLNPPEEAGARYIQMYQSRLGEYWQVNQRRDHEAGLAFWRDLTRDWLRAFELPESRAEALREIADQHTFDPESGVFTLYSDVRACLETLWSQGVRMAVISNWDYSLQRVLDVLGISEFFELVVASLQEGVEKPEIRLFEGVLARLGVAAIEALHVGDDPIDDLQGAKNAGMSALLLDRERGVTDPPYLATLNDLPKVLGWNG
jgi:putative hydrolase of the HAD superfamily